MPVFNSAEIRALADRGLSFDQIDVVQEVFLKYIRPVGSKELPPITKRVVSTTNMTIPTYTPTQTVENKPQEPQPGDDDYLPKGFTELQFPTKHPMPLLKEHIYDKEKDLVTYINNQTYTGVLSDLTLKDDGIDMYGHVTFAMVEKFDELIEMKMMFIRNVSENKLAHCMMPTFNYSDEYVKFVNKLTREEQAYLATSEIEVQKNHKKALARQSLGLQLYGETWKERLKEFSQFKSDMEKAFKHS